MVLPLLFSLGLPALAGSGALAGLGGLGAALGGMSVPALAGIGAGLGSFIQSGDLGEGIQTGLTSFLGGKILGGLSGSTSQAALGTNATVQAGAEAVKPGFLQSVTSAGPSVTQVAATPSNFATNLLGTEASKGALGALTAGQAAFMPAYIGQTMSDAFAYNRAAEKQDDDDEDTRPPMPNPMQVSYNPDPYASGGGEGLYFQYTRPPRRDGYEPQYPYYYAEGGILDLNQRRLAPSMGGHPIFSSLGQQLQGAVTNHYGNKVEPFVQKVERDARSEFGDDIFVAQTAAPTRPDRPVRPIVGEIPTQLPTGIGGKGAGDQPFKTPIRELFAETEVTEMAEGGEVDMMMEQNGMNEKDVIVEAIEAIKGMSEQPEIALAMFVQKYGEDALRDLVGRVQSGELDDTVARFEEGEKGMVRGPGDGSGVDDMVPATLEGEQDVLLSDGEFVLRKKTTDALEKAYGGGFLDIVNRAEEEAPEKLQQMVG